MISGFASEPRIRVCEENYRSPISYFVLTQVKITHLTTMVVNYHSVSFVSFVFERLLSAV